MLFFENGVLNRNTAMDQPRFDNDQRHEDFVRLIVYGHTHLVRHSSTEMVDVKLEVNQHQINVDATFVA